MSGDATERGERAAADRVLRAGEILVVVVALALRLGVVATDPFGITGPDAAEYAATARHVRAEGEIPVRRGSPVLPYPLYPLMLAATLSLGDPAGVLLAKLLNVVGGAGAALLACRVAARMAPRGAATLAGWAVALHPALVHYAGAISTESLFVPLSLAVLWAAARLMERPSPGRGAALGALMGLAALLRPSSAPASAAVGLVVAVVLLRSSRAWRPLLAATAACVLLVAPWTAYLSIRHGELILLSDAWGFSYWDGHHPVNARVDRAASPAERERLSAEKHAEMRRITEDAIARGASPNAMARAFRDAAEEHIEAGRVSRLDAAARNVASLLAFRPDPVVHGTGVALLFGAWLVPLTLLGAWGLLRALASRGAAVALCGWAAIGACVALSALFVGLIRYRFGHVDPILALGVPVALAPWLSRLSRLRTAGAAATGSRAGAG